MLKPLVLHSIKTCTPQHCNLYSTAPKLVPHSMQVGSSSKNDIKLLADLMCIYTPIDVVDIFSQISSLDGARNLEGKCEQGAV